MFPKVFLIVVMAGGFLHAMDRNRIQTSSQKARALLVTSQFFCSGAWRVVTNVPPCKTPKRRLDRASGAPGWVVFLKILICCG